MKAWSALAILELVCACNRKQQAEGPFEQAGKGLDTAAEKTGTALKTAGQKTGEAAHTAVHATGKALKKVGDKLEGSGSRTQGDKRADAGPPPSNAK